MSYQVIARKYRPHAFDDVIGQAHVTTPLRNALRTGRIPHALLFTGPRGTGKTTLARIFACCLNADKGPTDTPAADDPACLEIQNGTSTDVQEVDAASRTSVDDVREIIDSIRYAAAPGKWRIFIVDEVHMLSTPAFNALLKTLEEPPPQSLFIFCTTNPEKIPFTVVSRCQRYDLRRIATAEVAAALGKVAENEGVKISKASLMAVARAGDGSMRDSQTLLDQLIAFGGGDIEDERVAEVLDLIDRQLLFRIAAGCIRGDTAAALEACRQAWDTGIDAKRLGGELLATLRDLVVLRVAPGRGLVEGSDAEIAELEALAGEVEEVRLRRMFRALLREQEDLAWAPDPMAVLEIAVVRLATLPAGDQVEALLARIDALEASLRGGGAPGGGAGGGGRAAPRQGAKAGAPSSSRGKRAAPAERAQGPASEARGTEDDSAPASEPAPEPPRQPDAALTTPADPAAADPPASSSVPPGDAGAPLGTVFDRLCAFGQETNRGLFASLLGGSLLERTDDLVRIGLSSDTAVRRLEGRTAEVEEVCARFFNRPTRVVFENLAPADAPAENRPRRGPPPEVASEARRQRQEALQHPAVNDALDVLRAEILEIRPSADRAPGEPA